MNSPQAPARSAAITDAQIDAAIEALFPNDNPCHGQWMQDIARPIARAVLAAASPAGGQMEQPKHPLQPLVKDGQGVVRFKKNAIVRYLLDNGGIDMNTLATLEFSQEDREQFAQLIGYSLSGFGELSYVSDETYELAGKQEVPRG